MYIFGILEIWSHLGKNRSMEQNITHLVIQQLQPMNSSSDTYVSFKRETKGAFHFWLLSWMYKNTVNNGIDMFKMPAGAGFQASTVY